MLLLAAALVAQPVLATVGALHDLSAHAGAPHPHADDLSRRVSVAEDTGSSPAQTDPLHVLLHISQCCGNASALLFPLIQTQRVVPLRTMRFSQDVVAVEHSYPHGPFRPPIAA